MIDEVQVCVNAKNNFFTEYFSVPAELEGAVAKFAEDTTALGESCGSAVEFEEKFVSSGLSERFNSLFPKCTPKAKKMTREEKKESAKIAMEVLSDSKEELIKDAAQDLAEDVISKQRDKLLNESREQMIADGTYADHTIARNIVGDAVGIGGFFKKIFKK